MAGCLALSAGTNIYTFKDLPRIGPVFDSMKIFEGKVILSFRHLHGELFPCVLSATYHPK